MGEIKQKVVKGVLWTFGEKVGTFGVRFLVSMVLARLLTPNDYGTIALLSIFLSVSGVLADSGFGKALVQKKDATELDFNSVFYLSLVTSSLMYLVLFFCAPFIAAFYKVAELTPILRVMAFELIFGAINGVQNAELSRKMLFDLSFRISLVQSAASAISGVALAFCGYGPWALVWSAIVSGVVGVIMRWLVIAWRPSLMFSWKAVSRLFQYGWKMTVSSLFESLINQISGLIVGRFYSKADLAYVNRGQSMAMLPMDIVNHSLLRATFPAMAQLQNDPSKMRLAISKTIQCSSFAVFPLMAGCGICAEEIVRVLFGLQWLPAVPYVRLSCFAFAMWPIHTANLNALAATGRSDLYLKYSLAKKALSVFGLVIAIPWGVWWMMAVSALIMDPICLVLNIWPNRKLIGYGFMNLVHDVYANVFLCGVMLFVVMCVKFVARLIGFCPQMLGGSIFLICVETVVGACVYVGLAHICHVGAYMEYLSLWRRLIHRRT